MRMISPTLVRRMAISSQRLAGPQPAADADGILEVFRDLGCVQIDPLRAVERTQYLVLWSRLGHYDTALLDRLIYEERQLFEYWAHAASIVRVEDFPIYWRHMREWAPGDRPWMKRAQAWMATNAELNDYILTEIKQRGPLPSKDLHDKSDAQWQSSGWTNNQNVRQMLNYLWEQGKITVSHRKGVTKYWDLIDRCLPEWTPRENLNWPETVSWAAQQSLRALGVARADHINRHYTRNNYPGLEEVLASLLSEGRIVEVQVGDGDEGWPGPWYVHVENIPLLDRLEAGEWQPRTTLLSPFDNLICDRDRTELLFNFDFRIEIYVPKDKRQYGYYVLPILHGDRLIGRIDPKMDRKKKVLAVNAVYAEPEAASDEQLGPAVAEAVTNLAHFLEAKAIRYGRKKPVVWQEALVNQTL